jgi:outer membrane lipoprotein carrier protein
VIRRWETLLGLAALGAAVPPQDPGPILDRASAAYQTVSTLSATFVQVVDNPMVGGPDTTRGVMYLVRPDRFAMRFTDPQGDRIVADGRHLWLYTPSTTPGQVIRSPIPAHGTTGPNLIGQFVDHARERYQARYLRGDSLSGGWADVVALAPREPDQPYRDAVIWVDRNDGLLRRIDITETSGQRRVLVLQGLHVNQPIPTREVTFSTPKGVRVVDQ